MSKENDRGLSISVLWSESLKVASKPGTILALLEFLYLMHRFVRSGVFDVTIAAGTFRNAGINGNWWSSRADAATNAYNLNFNATTVYPSNGPNNRYVGRSLRCLLYAAVGADLFIFFSLYMSNTVLRQRRGKA